MSKTKIFGTHQTSDGFSVKTSFKYIDKHKSHLKSNVTNTLYVSNMRNVILNHSIHCVACM